MSQKLSFCSLAFLKNYTLTDIKNHFFSHSVYCLSVNLCYAIIVLTYIMGLSSIAFISCFLFTFTHLSIVFFSVIKLLRLIYHLSIFFHYFCYIFQRGWILFQKSLKHCNFPSHKSHEFVVATSCARMWRNCNFYLTGNQLKTRTYQKYHFLQKKTAVNDNKSPRSHPPHSSTKLHSLRF